MDELLIPGPLDTIKFIDKNVIINCDTNIVSDGYHTFAELYQHRILLTLNLIKLLPTLSWYSKKHNDNTYITGWFIIGIELPTGTITYHLPNDYLEIMEKLNITNLEKAKEWDGHTSNDVCIRLFNNLIG